MLTRQPASTDSENMSVVPHLACPRDLHVSGDDRGNVSGAASASGRF
jgi:hypothetical protein